LPSLVALSTLISWDSRQTQRQGSGQVPAERIAAHVIAHTPHRTTSATPSARPHSPVRLNSSCRAPVFGCSHKILYCLRLLSRHACLGCENNRRADMRTRSRPRTKLERRGILHWCECTRI
jgi:hypothetical protein